MDPAPLDETPAPVLLLGDPRLREVARPVGDPGAPEVRAAARRLVATLQDFRRRRGFGRAIAAPQIGVALRLVTVDLGDGARCLFNPRIEVRSDERFTVWDDCLSFPDLLVRVSRHRTVTVAFDTAAGATETWADLSPARSELLQHELDHLDGILAVDRAEGPDPLVLRSVFEADRARFLALADAVSGGLE